MSYIHTRYIAKSDATAGNLGYSISVGSQKNHCHMPYRKLILKCSAEKHLIIFRIMIAPRLPNLSGAGVFLLFSCRRGARPFCASILRQKPPKNILTTPRVRAIISHKYSKPVIERSISTQRMRKESRRRWKGGRIETEEWAHEGGKKAFFASNGRRDLHPLQRKRICRYME